ncbi:MULTISPECIES: ParB/RepB/Spo0J family partition protein [unclassified Brevundimonas]|uniref:ParB/RepB/Spo0J family partition protein n=1 Tax=unclassified Brevundimonas TaxID=2622653 RepID=UPI000CFD9766|nr:MULTISPECIES: ParB/RepB/Spo0J family partition protein [unclassified Brevundimonas]PRA27174.1 chromosome partitioning protein ParB [Brevundimonas sp. MYb27]PQZ77365.1 chromosome partitioning protein ParB [Brevundimonas sp. MYb31]PRB17591.1 chromosome partitioning protein ParB [Brevundimonas sp. MYb52]PRB37963.1 chromosome partitioning protein ParB [Brevundimonas sp. MYb46]PRB46312.1 chromosome partitioning protein ParB [Brevundimonas sp. MYb33]
MTAHDVQTAPTAHQTEVAPEPAHGAEIVVPLNRLKASPRNARKVKHSTAAIEALAASIRAKGVLQAPVVEIERDGEGTATGNYLVTIGEGRRQALRMLVKRKAIKRTHPVKVVVDTLNDAHEISLDENITREAMHPADQFEAFRKLAEEKGYGPEEIGARFGVTAHVVRQRLRLGAAASELMAAYRDGTLNLDLLTAFCVSEDQDRQRQVLEQMGPYTSVFAIRRAMTEAKVRADDRRVSFVGLEAYEAEGGAVLRDLFTEDGGGWLEDPALLARLVGQKLTGLAEEARQREGWKWAEACAEFSEAADFGRVYPVVVVRSEADMVEMAALSEEYDRLISEADAVEVLPPETDARLESIDKALQAYGPDYDYTPEAKARSGVIVMLGHDGLARFERGLVRAEDAAQAPPPPWDTDEGADGEAPEYAEADDARADGEASEPDEGLAPLSERLLIDLTAHKTMGLRDAVQADVAAALATVVHAMALQVFYPGYGDFTPLQLRLSAGGLERLAPGVGDSPAGRRVTDRLEAWGARLPERAEDLWSVVAGLRRSDLLDLLACCAGVGLHAVRDPHDRRPGAWAQAETLATAVGLDMAGSWSATAASYFSRVPKARVLEAVTEAVGAEEAGRIVGFKKGDMADAAERLLEGRGWLPTVLRVVVPEPESEAEVVAGEASPDAATSGDAEDAAPTDNGYAFAAE